MESVCMLRLGLLLDEKHLIDETVNFSLALLFLGHVR